MLGQPGKPGAGPAKPAQDLKKGDTLKITMGRKQEKSEQRKKYKEAFKGVKHGHGGRPIRKKEEAALGR